MVKTFTSPFSLQRWIQDNRDRLKPPVGNQVLYQEDDFIVMVVGGPNKRTDYHVNQGEEFFYQLEGDIELHVRNPPHHELSIITLKAGDIFLLPPQVPHSPQRPEHSVGLVIERKRRTDELDGFLWFCDHCAKMTYEETLSIEDLVKTLPEVFQRYHQHPASKKCPHCQHPVRSAS
jgi:3-hydroxyanthranilate 3,4-dioxygenase